MQEQCRGSEGHAGDDQATQRLARREQHPPACRVKPTNHHKHGFQHAVHGRQTQQHRPCEAPAGEEVTAPPPDNHQSGVEHEQSRRHDADVPRHFTRRRGDKDIHDESGRHQSRRRQKGQRRYGLIGKHDHYEKPEQAAQRIGEQNKGIGVAQFAPERQRLGDRPGAKAETEEQTGELHVPRRAAARQAKSGRHGRPDDDAAHQGVQKSQRVTHAATLSHRTDGCLSRALGAAPTLTARKAVKVGFRHGHQRRSSTHA